jgi:hypothetical protein
LPLIGRPESPDYAVLYSRPHTQRNDPDIPQVTAADVATLHDVCGVYTNERLARDVLAGIGWNSQTDLTGQVLLEPCAGDGAFVLQAAKALIASFKIRGKALTVRELKPRILSMELVPQEAEKARAAVRELLRLEGLSVARADSIARQWVRTGDFLLQDFKRKRFTHAAGNPPYVRWSRVPSSLSRRYEVALPPESAKGDLQLPFIAKTVSLLSQGGKLGFVCSDRWRHMAYGADFSRELADTARVSTTKVRTRPPFLRKVSAYAEILVVEKTPPVNRPSAGRRNPKLLTLGELGCEIRVGPALGCERAYVGAWHQLVVEPALKARFVRPAQILDGTLVPEDLWVVCMTDPDGKLVDPEAHPMLKTHLARYRHLLKERSIVRNGAPWYRPIDRVQAKVWSGPKLLIPEMAKKPRVALDDSGAIPSHGVYAILGPEEAIRSALERLKDGGLARALSRIAPKVNGGVVRCYKRFLEMIWI